MLGDDEPLPDAEALSNAELARAEFRAQIDQQLRTADSIDTKATALLTGSAAILALVAGRIQVGTELPRVVATSIMFVIALGLLYCALRALSSRDDFAYGAEGKALLGALEQERTPALALSLADALKEARDKNVTAVNGKHLWYQRTVALVFFLALSIASLFAVGAIR